MKVFDHLPQGGVPVNVSLIPASRLPESEDWLAIFPDQDELFQPSLIVLQQPGMRFPGYGLLDTFEDAGNIVNRIGRVDYDVYVLRHDNKSKYGKSPIHASSVDRLNCPVTAAITGQQGKSAIAGKCKFVGLPRNIEMMNLSSDRCGHWVIEDVCSEKNKQSIGYLAA